MARTRARCKNGEEQDHDGVTERQTTEENYDEKTSVCDDAPTAEEKYDEPPPNKRINADTPLKKGGKTGSDKNNIQVLYSGAPAAKDEDSEEAFYNKNPHLATIMKGTPCPSVLCGTSAMLVQDHSSTRQPGSAISVTHSLRPTTLQQKKTRRIRHT